MHDYKATIYKTFENFYDTYKYILKSPVHSDFCLQKNYDTYKYILKGPVHSDFILINVLGH